MITVGSWPKAKKIELMTHDIILNVSDEYSVEAYQSATKSGKEYHWFPMNECTSDMGINSIYGALTILHQAEVDKKTVYLHCHAGANRSPTVRDLYEIMKSGEPIPMRLHKPLDLGDSFTLGELMKEGKKNPGPYLVQRNIEWGHLPPKAKLEQFLKSTLETLTDDAKRGTLDLCKLKAEIQ